MSSSDKFFIEVDCRQLSEKGQSVSGDVYLQRRYKDRMILAMSDGAGSGIKANVVASVIASMAINYAHADVPSLHIAKAVIETFARGDRSEDVRQATFTIVDINDNGNVKIIEFENPKCVILREGRIYQTPRQRKTLKVGDDHALAIYITEFNSKVEDRIVSFSDGVVLSGYATRRMPFGWGYDEVSSFLECSVSENPQISASQLCRKVISQSEGNDLFAVKNDMSCAAVYFRRPRRILVCTGPPFDDKKDKELSDMIINYDGSTIISGGTTAQIISRESGREIFVILKRDQSGLPPASEMEGVSLVTEGVLTLGKVKVMLEAIKNSDVSGKGVDIQFVKMLLEHDIIEFVVGTRINAVHQDPTLPIELELRRNVIKSIARILETKFMKDVSIKYI